MNKMLRLKDLFKIDFSSKGGGKLADKIFNKYNITKEEREEVKNEIASGGGGGDSEEVWYEIIGGPVRYDELKNISSTDILDGIGGYAGIIDNSIVINSMNMLKQNPNCYFLQYKGVTSIQTDKIIILEYNTIEELIKAMGDIIGASASDIDIIIEAFYTKFKKVTYSRVLEKMKSLISA